MSGFELLDVRVFIRCLRDTTHTSFVSLWIHGQGADSWTTVVRGVEIPMTVHMIGRAWDLPIREMTTNSFGDWMLGFICILEREDVRSISIMVANQLLVEMWLLNYITARILVSKTGQLDFITKWKLMLITAWHGGWQSIFLGSWHIRCRRQ